MASSNFNRKLNRYLNGRKVKDKLNNFVAEQHFNGKEKVRLADGEVIDNTYIINTIVNRFISTVASYMEEEISSSPGSNGADRESVIALAQTLKASKPIFNTDDNTITVYISFTGDLNRPSLTDITGYFGGKYDGKTGPGIDNIVALFNNGTNDSGKQVFGRWESEGEDTWSLSFRPPLHFLQHALFDFNTTSNEDVQINAEMSREYGGSM